MMAEIQVATASALKEWSKQVVEQQVLRVDKVNRELRGPGISKLDKANCEAMQQILTMDFMHITLKHREEIMKLFGRHEAIVQNLRQDMEAIAEPNIPSAQGTDAAEVEEDKEDTDEPSILGVLNED
jgi:hypothetical protein